jgi:hypothetical protein
MRHLQRLVKEGREWAAAVDLESFFDEIPKDQTPPEPDDDYRVM